MPAASVVANEFVPVNWSPGSPFRASATKLEVVHVPEKVVASLDLLTAALLHVPAVHAVEILESNHRVMLLVGIEEARVMPHLEAR